MRPGNPAIYECPVGAIHHWVRIEGGRAECLNCGLVLKPEDADDCLPSTASGEGR